MERGSDQHNQRLDDAMKSETQGMMKSGRDTHAEEWKSAEPSGEDQPDVDLAPNGTLAGGVPDGMSGDDVEGRSELATYLHRSTFPAAGTALEQAAREADAPDAVLEELRGLPAGGEYANVGEVWQALHGGHEAHRF